MTRTVKALVLFSGGLDSILAVKLLQEQNIEATGLIFTSCFFDAHLVEKGAANLGLPLKIIDISDEHLQIVKKPRYGYGKNMNPCVDCHLMMLKKAKEIMRKEQLDFVATGEVLGERPFSQNRQALDLLEKKSNLQGYLLRPLSARLLKPTIAENQGLVNRNQLLDIQGRSRKEQIALANKWKIKEYPTPAGGCLLTDPGFSKRLKEMLNSWQDCDKQDIELLKLGRHFWFPSANPLRQRVSVAKATLASAKPSAQPGSAWRRPAVLTRCANLLRQCASMASALAWRVRQHGERVSVASASEDKQDKSLIVVGRNQEENKKMEKLVQPEDILIKLKDIPGPTTLVRDKNSDGRIRIAVAAGGGALFGCIEKAKELTKYYSIKARDKKSVLFVIS